VLSAKQVTLPDGTVKTLVDGPDALPAPPTPAFQLEELEAMLHVLKDTRERRSR
jgi:hypothetical protein